MPFWGKKTRFSAGKPIVARDLNRVAEAAEKSARLTAEPPLAVVSTAGGMLLRWAGMLFSVYVGITDTTISARSGSTPGSGNVRLQTWDGTNLADLSGPVTFKAYNISAAASGIPAGKYCIILRIAGNYWIVTVEC